MSRTCWSIWWLLKHRNGSPLAFMFVLVLGRRVRAFIRGFSALIGHIPPSLGLHIYISLWYTYLDWSTTFSLSLIPFVHVMDMAEGTDYECPHPFLGAWGTPMPYVGPPCVLGTPEGGGGLEPIGVLPSSLQ